MTVDPNIQTLLGVGMTEKEAAIYFALLNLGEATVAQIAERAKLKRSIVYVVLEELMKRGYASEFPGLKIRRFAPSDPTRLYRDLAANVENFKFMLPLLRSIHESSGKFPHIEILDDHKAISAVQRRLEYEKTTRYAYSLAHQEKYFPIEVERWRRHSLNPNDANESWHLMADEREGAAFAQVFAERPRQHFRRMEQGVDFPIDVSIADGFISVTSFEPLFMVIIHSKKIAKSFAAIFDVAWKNSRTVPVHSGKVTKKKK